MTRFGTAAGIAGRCRAWANVRPRARTAHSERGVSLVEAMVAMAVMAFGMLGIAGLQGSLRGNTDISRQRSEAVRIAQEVIEQSRAFSVINTEAGKVAYNDLLAGTTRATFTGTNTTFTRTVTVPAIANGQTFKQVIVDVEWVDRTNTTQSVRLSTTVHRVPPELGGSLGIPGNWTGSQGGRNPVIPRSAVPGSVPGTSEFSPPGKPSGTTWIFDNSTGYIVTCFLVNGQRSCTPTARLLSGYVNFATGPAQPTWVESESPPGTAISFGIAVNVTAPNPYPLPGTAPDCVLEPIAPVPPSTVQTTFAYYCLVNVDLQQQPNMWSGSVEFTLTNLATSASDADPTRFRVCRYTSRLSNGAVGSGSPPITNDDHPYAYAGVTQSLSDKNFLVIRAGDGSTPFSCPVDDPATTPLIKGDTFAHQPAP